MIALAKLSPAQRRTLQQAAHGEVRIAETWNQLETFRCWGSNVARPVRALLDEQLVERDYSSRRIVPTATGRDLVALLDQQDTGREVVSLGHDAEGRPLLDLLCYGDERRQPRALRSVVTAADRARFLAAHEADCR